jgi:hypothetical protein
MKPQIRLEMPRGRLRSGRLLAGQEPQGNSDERDYEPEDEAADSSPQGPRPDYGSDSHALPS